MKTVLSMRMKINLYFAIWNGLGGFSVQLKISPI